MTDIVALVDGVPRGGILRTDFRGFWTVALPGPWAAGSHEIQAINQDLRGLISLPSSAERMTVLAVEPKPTPVSTVTPAATPTPPLLTDDFATVLARHLTDTGAVMYGLYWCGNSTYQKPLFGDAFKYVNYVECDPSGENANPSLCAQEGITAVPTWKIGGQFYVGIRFLEELAQLSGFEPARP